MAETKSTVPAPHSPAELLNARALRGLHLYEEHGDEIQRIGEDLYRVPSRDGRRSYDVRYGEVEECPCPDHQYRGVTCCHLYAVGILMAKRHIIPVAGDPFAAAALRCVGCSQSFRRGQLVEIEESLTFHAGDLLCRRCWHDSDAVVL